MVLVDLFDNRRGFRIGCRGKGDHEGSMGGSHWKQSLGAGTGVGPKLLLIRKIVLGDRRQETGERRHFERL